MRTIVMKTSNGYRDQLERTRRFLSRVQSVEPKRDVDYQDDMWAFFQNCWHIKDWIKHDPLIHSEVKGRLVKAAEDSPTLMICNDMANGTKHLALHSPKTFAQHSHTNTTIIPGVETRLDCVIRLEDGKTRSAREVAKECMDEWDRILTGEKLAIGQMS